MLEFEAADGTAGELEPDFNVAPTKPVPVVRNHGGVRELSLARWGLIPSWATDPRAGAKLINARAESLAASPAFRAAFARRRCLVPADGWYEWAGSDTGRRVYFMRPALGGGLAFAGLWEVWSTGTEWLLSATIVTTAATGQLGAVHERMPLVLPRDRWATWLDPAAEHSGLLAPTPPDLVAGLELRRVGPAVGNVANNGEQLTAAWREHTTPPLRLF